MKISKTIFSLIFLLAIAVSAAYSQRSFIHLVSKENISCNSTCSVFDEPELAGNQNAVIFITPVDGSTPYRHPIGAYFMYMKKWSVFNLDGVSMPDGAKFKVEYYANADDRHFTYVAAQEVASFGVGYINHAGMDDNPTATVRFTAHISSLTSGNYNRLETKIVYDPTIRKWIIANVNGQRFTPGVAYNIGFNPGASATNANSGKTLDPNVRDRVPPSSPGNSCNCDIPSSLPPSGKAGGDLSGTYPDPTVIGLRGKPISGSAPSVGQSLKWSGSEWTPMTDPVSNVQTPTALPPNGPANGDLSGTYPNPTVKGLRGKPLSNTAPSIGQILKWDGIEWKPAADEVSQASAAPPPVTPANATPAAAAIQTFFKNGSQVTPPIINSDTFPLIELTQTIVLTKKSRLLISAAADIVGANCTSLVIVNGCPDTEAEFSANTFEPISNGMHNFGVILTVPGSFSSTAVISNFTIDLIPGTYTVEFKVANRLHTIGPIKSVSKAKARQSSIMVIPLE